MPCTVRWIVLRGHYRAISERTRGAVNSAMMAVERNVANGNGRSYEWRDRRRKSLAIACEMPMRLVKGYFVQRSQTLERSSAELDQQLERVIDKLSDEFSPGLPKQIVEERTRHQIKAFRGARITNF